MITNIIIPAGAFILPDNYHRISVKKVDSILSNLGVKRIGDFINTSTPFLVECIHDKHQWMGRYSNLYMGKGCAMCSGSLKKDLNYIKTEFEKRNLTLVDSYINMNRTLRISCNKCNHVWNNSPSHVIHGVQGCPKCNIGESELKSIVEVDNALLSKGLMRIGEYTGNNKYIKVKCNKDGYEWDARFANIVKSQHNGCPRCSGKEKYTNERVDYLLKDKPIYRIGDYINAKDKILFGCKRCNNEWLASPSRIINNDRGCPCCYKKSENKIKDILMSKNIKYIPQYNIKIDNKNVFVDFYINEKVIIERNGEQHYKPVRFGGMSLEEAKDKLEKQINRDSNLSKYCIENGINLVIIPYWYTDIEIKIVLDSICL